MTGLIQFQGGGAAFRPRTSVTDDDGHGEMMHTVPDFSSGGKSKEFDPAPASAAAAMSPPSRRPAPPAEILPSSYIMTSYLKPTVVRQRPRMWMGGCGGGGGLGASAARHSSAAAVSSPQHSSGSKRPRHYESDDEDDSSSSSDEDEEEELPIEFSSPLPPPPPRKVGRRSRTHRSPFLATSGGPPRHRWAPVSSSGISRPSCNFRKSVVTFSRPLVTLVRFRPRTSPDEKAGLYYCRDDQNRFRAEYREEKRRRMMGEWESEDEDEDDDDIIEAKGNGDDPNDAGDDSVGHEDDEPANQENGPEDVDAIPVTVEKSQEGGKEDNKGEDDVHEVTESSSSNEDESDGEDEDGDEAAQ